jgi:hypothetical protein
MSTVMYGSMTPALLDDAFMRMIAGSSMAVGERVASLGR